MPINPMYFQILSPQQANGFGVGLQQGTNVVGQNLQNQLMAAQAPYASQMAQAQLAATQQQAPYMQSQTQLNQASLPYVGYKFMAPMLMAQARMAQAGIANSNSFRQWVQTPQGQKWLSENPSAGMTVLNSLNNSSRMVDSGTGFNGGMNLPGANFQPNTTVNSQFNTLNPNSYTQLPLAPGAAQMPEQPLNPQQINKLSQQQSSSLQQQISDQQKTGTLGYNSRFYSTLPDNQKQALLAQAAGMGYMPTQASQLLMQGSTIQDLATAKGFDPTSMPTPIYPTTANNVNQIQKRAQTLTEINTLNPILTNAIAPYARRFDGYSPSQIASAIKGDNPDIQAQYLAARALQPEMSALRLKAMNGQVGIEALREVTDASMGNLKAYEPLVSPKIYKQMQNNLDQWITQAVSSANKTGLTTYGAQNNSVVNSPQTNSAQTSAPSISKVLNGRTYVKTNGQWYAQ